MSLPCGWDIGFVGSIYGLLGLRALFRPFQVRREKDLCIDCHKCDRVCPASIQVSSKKVARSPECVGCLECVAVCPKQGCISVGFFQSRSVRPYQLVLAIVTSFLLFYGVARMSGYWQSEVPPDVFRDVYRLADQLEHP
ncbi:MAG: 4Fe-4S dicluster domain-containing protein [Desulfobulbaceae bacterium]|uniref:4Fe-4S dicluster domain-containing protein n=1 Tax=Candidatus Desulfatifera sulfidica TaxID=2841691 RepID=A0A8J6N691_9BACT|nr:4Fe-4S dicluster domain-containing protein [Candidatus Desulfatifera sulfidica]